MLDALESAARRGAKVRVRLEGRPSPDAAGGLRRHNVTVISELRACGADASLIDEDGTATLHAKAATIDGTLYADDVNFAGSGTLLRARPAPRTLVWRKSEALELEARLLERARVPVAVETESLGSGNAVYSALERIGRAGLHPRLLVSREALTTKERSLAARLNAAGVQIRACGANEKLAIAGDCAWIGSANATSAYLRPQTCDWALSTRRRAVRDYLSERFERRWNSARVL